MTREEEDRILAEAVRIKARRAAEEDRRLQEQKEAQHKAVLAKHAEYAKKRAKLLEGFARGLSFVELARQSGFSLERTRSICGREMRRNKEKEARPRDSIYHLYIREQVLNKLLNAGLSTLQELAAAPDDYLLRIEGIGPKTVREIREKTSSRQIRIQLNDRAEAYCRENP